MLFTTSRHSKHIHPSLQVSTLAAGQFVIEYLDLAPRPPHEYVSIRRFPLPLETQCDWSRSAENAKEPLLDSPSSDRFESDASSSYPPPRPNRPRSKSKPDSIFIHPNHSNIARADAVALELGLPTSDRPRNGDTWKGYSRRDPQHPFRLVDDESDSD